MSLCGALAQMHQMNHETHQTNPNWGTFYKITSCSFHSVKVTKHMRLKKCHKLEDTQEI